MLPILYGKKVFVNRQEGSNAPRKMLRQVKQSTTHFSCNSGKTYLIAGEYKRDSNFASFEKSPVFLQHYMDGLQVETLLRT